MKLQMATLVYAPGRPYLPIEFRSPRGEKRAPTKGGRWSVRRVRLHHPTPWMAYCKGRAKGLSASFPTQLEAVTYAQGVAAIFAALRAQEALETGRTWRAQCRGRRLESWSKVSDILSLHQAAES